MNTLDSAHRPIHGDGWQLLGELELTPGSNAEDLLPTRLMEILEPLNLHADFQNRLLSSAQDAATRALNSNAGSAFEHIHLAVFAPGERTAQGHIWGFFRIEKIDSTESKKDHPDHAVEFYLYLEG